MVADELRSLKLLVFATATFSLLCVFLNSTILAKGLRGAFSATTRTTTDNVGGIISVDETKRSQPKKNSRGGKPAETKGDCQIDVRVQKEGETVVGVPPWHAEDNIIVKLAGAGCQDVGISPTWTVAEWDYTIVQIASSATFQPPEVGDDERQLIKIIKGSLLDVNLNGIFDNGHWETYVVTVPNRAVPLFIDNSIDEIKAGADGAVIIYMKTTEQALNTPLTDMTSAPATTISGPFSENFQWKNFGEVYPDPFAGVEFWNLGAINIQHNDGSRLHNMQWWTFREDFDVDGYHDHSDLTGDNAFGEVHMTTHVPNGVTGMQTTLPGTENLNFIPNPDEIPSDVTHKYNNNDQKGVQIAIPLPPGSAHGPLWSVDPSTGKPTFLCSGAIQYPFHRMIVQANGPPNSPLRYVSWVAFEHPPEEVTVPLKMLTEWPNAFLQSTMTPEKCEAELNNEMDDESDESGMSVSSMVRSGQPEPTVAECLINVRLQEEGEIVVGVPPWHADNNVIVQLAGKDCEVGVSPTWTIADWDYTIVQIGPNATFIPPEVGDDERQLVKIIQGTLLDVNLNGIFTNGHWESYVVTVPNRAVPLYIDNSVDAIPAGEDGAVIVYMKVSEDALNTPLTDMTAAPATIVDGPFSENFQWKNFGEIYPDPFQGVEFWNLGAINIQNYDGSRLHNLQWWTFREDFNADGYHDHSDLTGENAFGEIHMTTHVPNGVTGMQTALPNTKNLNFVPNPDDIAPEDVHKYNNNDQTEVQIAIPLPPGFAHGPLWSVDPSTGMPTFLCNGAIQYPFHRMIVDANGPPNSPLRYVSWVAFEHPPEDVTVPLKMLTEWPNAYLQSTKSPPECEAESNESDEENEAAVVAVDPFK